MKWVQLCMLLQTVIMHENPEEGVVPERWLDKPGPLYRCPNEHVSSSCLDHKGTRCVMCREPMLITFPEDTDGPIEHEAIKCTPQL